MEGPRLRPLPLPFIAVAEKCGILTAIPPALSLQGSNKKCPSGLSERHYGPVGIFSLLNKTAAKFAKVLPNANLPQSVTFRS